MKLNARDSGEEGKMLKHCVKTTISSLLKAISKLHTNRAPIGDAHKLFLSDTSTCTHTHTHCIRAGQRFVHVYHALNGLWNRLRRGDSVSTLWIAKQIQLGLPVININNRLTLFSYRLNIIFPGVLNKLLQFRLRSFRNEPWVEHSGCESCVLLKAHKGTIAEPINIPWLAFLHMPCSYTPDLCYFVKQIELQRGLQASYS